MKSFQAKVLDIVTTIGKDGLVTPNIKIEPQVVNGKKYTLVSVRKFNTLMNRDIRKGDTVNIQVFEQNILSVREPIMELRPEDTEAYKVPKNCPVCNSQLHVLKDRYYCYNAESCKGIINRRISHAALACRTAFNTKITTLTTRALVAHLKIKYVGDLYGVTDSDFLSAVSNVPKRPQYNPYKELQDFRKILLKLQNVDFKTFLSVVGFSYVVAAEISCLYVSPEDLEVNWSTIDEEISNTAVITEVKKFFNSLVSKRNYESLLELVSVYNDNAMVL